MVIGFDGSRAFLAQKTGTENYSYNLLKNLAKIDRENQYFIYLRDNLIYSLRDWPKNFSFKVISLPRLWTQIGLSWQTFLDPLDILLVPAHTVPLIHKPGLKTVMTVHDLGVEYLPWQHQLKQLLYLKFITYFQLHKVTRLIAVSQATKQDLIKKIGVSPEKITVIHEGVDTQRFHPISNDLVVKRLKRFDIVFKKYFLFVGTIQPRKNLVRLIQAYHQYLLRSSQSSEKLILVGRLGWNWKEVIELPKRLQISDRVIFLHNVDDSDLPILYNGARALLFPSLFEGFGLPILEAFACGCPVLTSNISAMPEVAGDAAVLVDPYRVDSIYKGIIKVAEPRVAKQLREKGLKRVQNFSWYKVAEETLSLLEKIHRLSL